MNTSSTSGRSTNGSKPRCRFQPGTRCTTRRQLKNAVPDEGNRNPLWGLRRGEVATLHRSQFALEDRIVTLVDRPDWNGYLFSSSNAESGHVTPETITARFKRLAERADFEIRTQTPTPQYGRRFWYRRYFDTVERLSEQVQAVADERLSRHRELLWRGGPEAAT